MGFFKKVFGGVKNLAKNIPVIGNAVKAADGVYNALKSSKKKGSSPSKAKASASEKIKDKAKQWFPWAPNWMIIAGAAVIAAIVGFLVFGKKKRRRR